MASLLRKLQDKSFLSDSEMVIAKYLIENYREVSNLSTRELASRTYSSSAAIVRFSQKLGFKGYSDFRINFLLEIMKHGEEVQAQLISEQDNLETIMRKVREINIDAINKAYDMLNPALLARTLKLFEKATYIDFYVMDRYMNFANEIAETFVLAGKFSSIHNSMPVQYLQAYKTPKRHLGFFISPRGENRLQIDIAKLLKRQSVPTILITASEDSSLSKLVTEHFTVGVGKDIKDLGKLVFTVGVKFITDTLVAALVSRTNIENAEEKYSWLNEKFFY
ncbi:MAG: MurR/RpiR family transcriptional regulator [Selenomonadaceae bacterium]|nr:MurR/RpiR family transcriptional regulator [Selenomonadaceae bacterium]